MRPGRPRCPRRIENEPDVTYFKPRGVPLDGLDVVILSLEELEAVRLIDLEGMEQEQASQKMGISRRAFWEDLQGARRRIVEALVGGKAIEIKGGSYMVEVKRKFRCYDCQNEWEEPYGTGRPQKCPECGCMNIHRHPDDRGYSRPVRGGRGRCFRGVEETP
jgi:predicted DNA-binding protein (UPF0251 family)